MKRVRHVRMTSDPAEPEDVVRVVEVHVRTACPYGHVVRRWVPRSREDGARRTCLACAIQDAA